MKRLKESIERRIIVVFLRNKFFLCLAVAFIACTLVILPTQAVFADTESEKHDSQGDIHFDAREYEDAVKEFTEAILLEDDNPLYYTKRGYAYYKSGDYDKALLDFNRAIQLDASYVDAYEGRAMVYFQQRKFDDVKINYKDIASIYFSAEQYDEAAEALKKALGVDNSYSEAYLWLGDI